MKPARISKRAQEDLEAIRSYISADNPDAAEQVRQAFLDSADLLAQNVEAGTRILDASPRHADVRWFVVPRFRNYLIFYRPYQDSILVLRILHSKRIGPSSSAKTANSSFNEARNRLKSGLRT